MLGLCLEKLSLVPEIESIDVRIFLDTCSDEKLADVEYVRNVYLPTAEIFRASEHIKVLSGCYNILQSLKAGFETGKKFVFMVEEDVFVKPEFFDLHWRVQNSGNYFVTCGRRHGRMPINFYSNSGTCYRRESLGLVLPHITEEYFRNPGSYLDRVFPEMKGLDGPLDDGLIRKVQRSVNGKVLCMDPPICSHVGFRRYNNTDGYMNTGKTIQEKIQCLREMLPRINPKTDKYVADFEVF